MKIKWLKNDQVLDLAGTFNGKCVDVVMRHNGSWSIFFNNSRIVKEIHSRAEAKKWIEDFLGANN
jgi:hypothetical protein